MKKIISIFLICVFLISLTIYFGNDFLILFESDSLSKSIGNIANGKLINGKRLPSSGANFVTFSRLGSLIGRNGVHKKVRDVILESFDMLYKDYPEYKYVLGETSWLSGGKMKPHRTHQNGLSVDFMVPTRNHDNEIEMLSTTVFNKFGYNTEFDSTGQNDEYYIDFESMAIHLYYLYKAASEHGVKIDLVIFDPTLQKLLIRTKYGTDIKEKLRFTTKPVWVRHDEHYHINFKVP